MSHGFHSKRWNYQRACHLPFSLDISPWYFHCNHWRAQSPILAKLRTVHFDDAPMEMSSISWYLGLVSQAINGTTPRNRGLTRVWTIASWEGPMMYVCSCHPCFGPSAANILPISQLVSFCYILLDRYRCCCCCFNFPFLIIEPISSPPLKTPNPKDIVVKSHVSCWSASYCCLIPSFGE